MREEWRQIPGFPTYEVSELGRVVDTNNDILIAISYTNQGAAKVNLRHGNRQVTRSVKRLVAEAFVHGETMAFDTPIHLDGDQENCSAQNLMWRPRYFAWHYTRQFNNFLDVYNMGPILELSARGEVLEAYSSIEEASVINGLLMHEIWEALHQLDPRRKVFPTGQLFSFPNKV